MGFEKRPAGRLRMHELTSAEAPGFYKPTALTAVRVWVALELRARLCRAALRVNLLVARDLCDA